MQPGNRNHNFLLYIFPLKWAVKAAAEQCSDRLVHAVWAGESSQRLQGAGEVVLPLLQKKCLFKFLHFASKFEVHLLRRVGYIFISPHRGNSLESDVEFRANKRNK